LKNFKNVMQLLLQKCSKSLNSNKTSVRELQLRLKLQLKLFQNDQSQLLIYYIFKIFFVDFLKQNIDQH